jgi:hypothetical protein
MENQSVKLSAPRPIFKAKSNLRDNTLMTPLRAFSDCPFNNYDFPDKQKSYSNPLFKSQKKIKNMNDYSEIEKDFEEFSIKSEILGILRNSKCKLNYSGSTCFTSKFAEDVSEETITEEKDIFPPDRSKKPVYNDIFESNNEEDKNYKINFSRFLKKKVEK